MHILSIPDAIPAEQKPKYIPEQKRIAKIIKILLVASVILLTIFVFAVTNIFLEIPLLPTLWLGVIQYLSYGGIIISSGLIIYIWIYEYIKKSKHLKERILLKI